MSLYWESTLQTASHIHLQIICLAVAWEEQMGEGGVMRDFVEEAIEQAAQDAYAAEVGRACAPLDQSPVFCPESREITLPWGNLFYSYVQTVHST
jgi:hypothetical protein